MGYQVYQKHKCCTCVDLPLIIIYYYNDADLATDLHIMGLIYMYLTYRFGPDLYISAIFINMPLIYIHVHGS